jgi:UDP-glucose 4-epimerase
MKILITGGAGFIGSHVVDAYCASGATVHVIDNLATGQQANVNLKAKLHQVDVTDEVAVRAVFEQVQPELVIHCAAQASIPQSIADPDFDEAVNVGGMRSLIQAATACASVKRFVNVSTAGVLYGDAAERPTVETAEPVIQNPYVQHKLEAEALLIDDLPFSIVTLRLSNVYGPRQNPKTEAGVVAIFIEALLEGRTPVVNGDGLQTRDFVYVSDVVAAIEAVASSHVSGVFHVGSATETTVQAVFETVAKALGASDVVPDHGPAKGDEQRYSCISSEKLKAAVGWEPRVPFAEGVLETAMWFQRSHNK